MLLDTEILVDIKEVQEFIDSSEFIQFLLNNSTDVSVPAFILQAVQNEIDKIKEGKE